MIKNSSKGSICREHFSEEQLIANDDGGCCQHFDDPFAAICGWVPPLFVNRGDAICSGFIGYFQNRENMKKMGMGGFERLASQECIIRNIFSTRKIEPAHLLASAKLNINSSDPLTNLNETTHFDNGDEDREVVIRQASKEEDFGDKRGMEAFAHERKSVFDAYGPSHITDIDWKNPDHRRCVMASLVQGVRIIERDRQNGRIGPQALAPPWYESFHFKLHEKIYDTKARCMFGAIYQHKSPASSSIPKYVIAFRGTLQKRKTVIRDWLIDIEVILNKLHKEKRFQQALLIIKKMVASAGAANVWLAGYSLGAAIALLAGKEMAKMNDQPHLLETYLFNPPFVSLSLERMKHQELKPWINMSRAFFRGTIAATKSAVVKLITDDDGGFDDPFAAISRWVPHLFVNKGDIICSGFIGYFQTREYMKQIGMGAFEKLASQESIIRNLCSTRKIEPAHLLASAELSINSSDPLTNLKSDHSLRQWWAPNLICEAKIYRYE
ncbi:hypothetical protein L6164_013549 [Bauhinia variegata]|uniref:Uncharacterized protein n=1 Tax=Bauhinia variegata TaxID=167791 RepID=A0ACB9NEI6_BAUVA|nr:hypothetical protein L6164_013549 [Bauhinia variegata]